MPDQEISILVLDVTEADTLLALYDPLTAMPKVDKDALADTEQSASAPARFIHASI